MKLTLLLYTIGYLSLILGQYPIHQTRTEFPKRMVNTTLIHAIHQLPPSINSATQQHLLAMMPDFQSKLVFLGGQILDLETWANDDTINRWNTPYILPKYELYYELNDSSIGISNYRFQLNLDCYAQLLKMDWPKEHPPKRSAFIPCSMLLKYAKHYARKRKYDTNNCQYQMCFDDDRQQLSWHFSFLQSSEPQAYDTIYLYKTVVVDVFSYTIVDELEQRSLSWP